jgi:hypothetical protein
MFGHSMLGPVACVISSLGCMASSRDMDMQTPVYGNRQAVSAGKQVQAGSIKGERNHCLDLSNLLSPEHA